MTTKYYRLIEVTLDEEEEIFVSQAFLNCCMCGTPISSTSGPDHAALCSHCGNGVLKGFVGALVQLGKALAIIELCEAVGVRKPPTV